MNKEEEREEKYSNSHSFSHKPPPYKLSGSLIILAHALVLQTPKLPHLNSKSRVVAEVVGKEPSSYESIT